VKSCSAHPPIEPMLYGDSRDRPNRKLMKNSVNSCRYCSLQHQERRVTPANLHRRYKKFRPIRMAYRPYSLSSDVTKQQLNERKNADGRRSLVGALLQS